MPDTQNNRTLTVEHLKRIPEQKLLLGDLKLHDFGRINIICGKNNSGKSTLLRGIEATLSKHPNMIGKYLDRERIEQIWNEYFAHEEPSRSSLDTDLRSKLKDHTENIARQSPSLKHIDDEHNTNDRHILFGEDILDFSRELGKKWEESSLLSQEQVTFGMNSALNRIFFYPEIPKSKTRMRNKTFKPILLDPKRSVEITCEIDTVQTPLSDGNGVLNRLFAGLTSPETSKDRQVFDKVTKAFRDISGYDFFLSTDNEISPPNHFTLGFHKKNGPPWIGADKCGLGLQELLVILYFSITPDYNVVLLEEPETHLHPDMQRKLLTFLREQSEQTGKQFFITTHSNIFLDYTLVDKVFLTSFQDDKGNIEVTDTTNKAFALSQLGYAVADNLVSDLTILVEGPSDIPVIQVFLKTMGLDEKYNIKIWPLGGDIMGKKEVDLSVIAENHLTMALIDRDPGSKSARTAFMEKCKDLDIIYHQLERNSIEEYFTLDALKAVLKGQVPETLKTLDRTKRLKDQLIIEYLLNGDSLKKLKNVDLLLNMTNMFQEIKDEGHIEQESDVEMLERAIACLDNYTKPNLLAEIASRLEVIKDKSYKKYDDFIKALEETLGSEDVHLYKERICKYAKHSMTSKNTDTYYKLAKNMSIDDIIEETGDLYNKFLTKVKEELSKSQRKPSPDEART